MKVKPVYSAAEVARMLHQSKATVGRWIKRGQLASVEVGGRKMVPIAALRTSAMLWESIRIADHLNARAA